MKDTTMSRFILKNYDKDLHKHKKPVTSQLCAALQPITKKTVIRHKQEADNHCDTILEPRYASKRIDFNANNPIKNNSINCPAIYHII